MGNTMRWLAILALLAGCGGIGPGASGALGSGGGGGGGAPSSGGGWQSAPAGAGSGGGGGGGFSESTPTAATGDYMGATPGGAQDIGYARELIANGQIPPADSITVEGLLSEHDLPVDGEPCDNLVCVRPALAIAPSLESGSPQMWLHLGMVSGLKKSTFERPPIDLAIVVDHGGAMSIDMTETAVAVSSIIDQLRDDDRLAVVTFNSDVNVLRKAGSVWGKESLKAQVMALQASGGADIIGGMKEGYAQLRDLGDDPSRLRRVLVLSCGYPGVGETLQSLVGSGADERIGLTYYGVLLSLDYALANALSQEKGGNYFYLSTLDEVVNAFVDELDTIISPLAYDMHVDLTVPQGYELAELYGLPGQPGAATAGFDIKTAFPSKRRGAVLARLERTGSPADSICATVSMSYTPESAWGWSEVHDEVHDVPDAHAGLGPDDSWFASNGVRKAVALVGQVERMQAAITTHASDPAAGAAILDELHAHLVAEADAIDDTALLAEAELVAALRALF